MNTIELNNNILAYEIYLCSINKNIWFEVII